MIKWKFYLKEDEIMKKSKGVIECWYVENNYYIGSKIFNKHETIICGYVNEKEFKSRFIKQDKDNEDLVKCKNGWYTLGQPQKYNGEEDIA